MKIETYLDAYIESILDRTYRADEYQHKMDIRSRQTEFFRARILRMFEEKDAEIEQLKESCQIYGRSILDFLEDTND